jgi:hypothetical protein
MELPGRLETQAVRTMLEGDASEEIAGHPAERDVVA